MYLIPRNISKRFEFFPGWGWQELLILLAAVGVGLAFAVALGFLTCNPARFLLVVLMGGLGYVATQPVMADGSSAMAIMRYMKRFRNQPKLYLFQKGGL